MHGSTTGSERTNTADNSAVFPPALSIHRRNLPTMPDPVECLGRSATRLPRAADRPDPQAVAWL